MLSFDHFLADYVAHLFHPEEYFYQLQNNLLHPMIHHHLLLPNRPISVSPSPLLTVVHHLNQDYLSRIPILALPTCFSSSSSHQHHHCPHYLPPSPSPPSSVSIS